MLRIEVTHTFDVNVAEAFAYITDVKNWSEYWPNFIRIPRRATISIWSSARGQSTADRPPIIVR